MHELLERYCFFFSIHTGKTHLKVLAKHTLLGKTNMYVLAKPNFMSWLDTPTCLGQTHHVSAKRTYMSCQAHLLAKCTYISWHIPTHLCLMYLLVLAKHTYMSRINSLIYLGQTHSKLKCNVTLNSKLNCYIILNSKLNCKITFNWIQNCNVTLNSKLSCSLGLI